MCYMRSPNDSQIAMGTRHTVRSQVRPCMLVVTRNFKKTPSIVSSDFSVHIFMFSE